MRARRSKKYRKIMSTYTLHFSFRTPYQVLCDTNFLRQCHAFSMPLTKFLSNTLHGEAKPYITQCSLAKAMAEHKAAGRGKGRGDGKPVWLPPPTDVPLRYCKHKDADGTEVVLGEAECLVDLVGGQATGNEVRRNKNHYVLATAEDVDEVEESKKRNHSGQESRPRKRKRGVDVREYARQIPGVPIVYVKRSVMILEELSGVSERAIRGQEKEKFKDGLPDLGGLKRKRGNKEDESDESDADITQEGGPKIRGMRKAKGPNPLSMRKKKAKVGSGAQDGAKREADGNAEGGHKRKRKRKNAGNENDGNGGVKSEAAVVQRDGKAQVQVEVEA